MYLFYLSSKTPAPPHVESAYNLNIREAYKRHSMKAGIGTLRNTGNGPSILVYFAALLA